MAVSRLSYGAPVFEGPDLRVVLDVAARKAITEASELPDNQVLGSTVEELVNEILSRHDMEVPVLLNDQREVSETGSGTGIVLHVPFTGTHGLFDNRPNFYTSQYPPGEVVGREVLVPLGSADASAAARADAWARLAQQYLDAVRHDLEIWRDNLRDQLRRSITRRHQEAEAHQEGVRSLGIPIRRRDDAPRTFTKPAIVRRESPTSKRGGSVVAGADEPVLSDEYYDHILFVIRAAGYAMERSPATYAGWGEEDRRQVLS